MTAMQTKKTVSGCSLPPRRFGADGGRGGRDLVSSAAFDSSTFSGAPCFPTFPSLGDQHRREVHHVVGPCRPQRRTAHFFEPAYRQGMQSAKGFQVRVHRLHGRGTLGINQFSLLRGHPLPPCRHARSIARALRAHCSLIPLPTLVTDEPSSPLVRGEARL